MKSFIRIFCLVTILAFCIGQQCNLDILELTDTYQIFGDVTTSGINAGLPSGEILPERGEAVSIRVISYSIIPANIVIRYYIPDVNATIEVHWAELFCPALQTMEPIGPDLAAVVIITGTYANGQPTPTVQFIVGQDFIEGDTKDYIIPNNADPNDQCPYDPDKTAPGICGCGIHDTDSDGDDTPDCIDKCPNNPDKTAPGNCGCELPDVDSDGDGKFDCNDQCPNDPNKTEPGLCGCNKPDLTDANGNPTCRTAQPSFSPPDSDGDGIPDQNDNCPHNANPQQQDTDEDDVGDICDQCPGYNDKQDIDSDGKPDDCDNCPVTANPDQTDTDGDGWGDLCDVPCDLNHDGVVDDYDLDVFMDAFGRSYGSAEYNPEADMNSDGTVDFVDYQLWLLCYNAAQGDFDRDR